MVVSVGALTMVVACAASASVECPDRSVCPRDNLCIADVGVAEPVTYHCASPAAQAACENKEPGAACDIGRPGTCVDQVCEPTLTCGDGVVDAPLGEQCDDGLAGFSGDGCTGACLSEYGVWRDATPAIPASRLFEAVVPDPRGDGLLMFGGGLPDSPSSDRLPTAFDDLWRWDGVTWRPVAQPVRPPARSAAAIALAPAVPSGQGPRAVMFGGIDASLAVLGDTWEWDGVTWEQRTPAVAPSARRGAALACAPGRCILFGGQTGVGPSPVSLDDTWQWDGTTWTQLTSGTHPGAYPYASMAFDAAHDRMVLFTANNAIVPVRETWELTATTGWRKIVLFWSAALINPSQPINVVYRPAASGGPGSVYMMVGTFSSFKTELWRLDDGPSETWRLVTTDMAPLVAATALDPVRGTFVAIDRQPDSVFESNGTVVNPVQPVSLPSPDLTGGAVAAAYDPRHGRTLAVTPDGTFAWSGEGFQRLVPPPPDALGPASTLGVAVAYDTRCDQLITFGGVNLEDSTETPLAATWRFTGTTWQLIARPPGAAPGARSFATMAYDARRDRVVMFGGASSTTTELGDGWELDTSDGCAAPRWVPVPPGASSPPPRREATLTYDDDRRVSVLHGGLVHLDGIGSSTAVLGDTWEWDGTSWTERVAPGATAPDPRRGHGAAYDPVSRRLVLVGGVTPSGTTATTRAFDAATGDWTDLVSVVEARPRSGHTLVRDRHGLLAFGGEGPNGKPATMARLTSEQVQEPAERCLTADDDADHDGLAGCADPDCWVRCQPMCRPTPNQDPARTEALAACAAGSCGDGTCAPTEDSALCPIDCPVM